MRPALSLFCLLAISACGSTPEPAPTTAPVAPPTPPPTPVAPPVAAPTEAARPATTGALTLGSLVTLGEGAEARAYVVVDEPGDVVARTGEGTAVLGTRHVIDTADPEDPTLEEYVILAEGPAPFDTLTLVGQGACTTRVARQIETRMRYLAPDGTRRPSEDDLHTLLEVAPCAGLGGVQRALAGRSVVFHAFALPGDTLTPDLARVVEPFEAMARQATGATSARPVESLPFVSRPNVIAVFGDHACIVRDGAVVLDYDGWTWGEVIAGDRTFVVMDSTSDGLDVRDVDTLTAVEPPT